jgi:hypothetical protein
MNTSIPTVALTAKPLEMATPSTAVCSISPASADQPDCLGYGVRFLTEMEVRHQRVLREIHQQVTDQHHQRRIPALPLERGRYQLQQRHRDHEAGGERDQPVERCRAPAPARRDGCRAQHVGARPRSRAYSSEAFNRA